jgi:hypothetical protein
MRQRFNPAAYAVSNNPPPPIVTPQIPPPLPARAYGQRDTGPNPEELAEKVKAASEPVQVGSRVYCGLYGGSTGIVYEIVGEQHPEQVRSLGGGVAVTGGNAHFKIVFLGERSHRSSIPEAILHGGGQWEILAGTATAEEIQTALAENEVRQKAAKAAQLAKEAALAKERAELPAKYPQLQTTAVEGKHKRPHVIAAINIRIQLNCAFPSTKFSVRSENGNINVNWESGPTNDAVVTLTNKYQEGNFDGMTDSYEYNSDRVWPDVFGGAKYVFARRDIPMALRQQVNEAMVKFYADRDFAMREASELLVRTVIPSGATFKGIGQHPDTATVHHSYYIEWNEPVQPAHAPPGAPSGKLSLVQGIHTKKNTPIWTASLTVRVERPEFESIRNQAKKLGGYYSMYRGEGAIPGFIFTTEAAAYQFMALYQSSAPAAPSDAIPTSVTPPAAPENKNEPEPEPNEAPQANGSGVTLATCPEIPDDSAPEPMQAMEAIGGPLTQPMRHSFGFFPPRPVKTLEPEPVNETEQPEPEPVVKDSLTTDAEQPAARDPWVLPNHPFDEPQPPAAVITPDAASVRTVPSWRRRFGH